MSNPYINRIASYALVDAAISDWCKRHSLSLVTDYKDYDVRSVDVVSAGRICQVWIDPPEHGVVTVHIWPYGSPHKRLTTSIEDIAKALDRAYDLALRFLEMKA